MSNAQVEYSYEPPRHNHPNYSNLTGNHITGSLEDLPESLCYFAPPICMYCDFFDDGVCGRTSYVVDKAGSCRGFRASKIIEDKSHES